MLERARSFFVARGVLEVETPALIAWPVSDPQLVNVRCQLAAFPARPLYLHTSPEYHMKRLLAAGSPDIYQISKVFRDGETGRQHLPEFTMVEWYRRGLTLQDIIAETCTLIADVAGAADRAVGEPRVFSYQELLREHAGVDPLAADAGEVSRRTRDLLGDRIDPALGRRLGDDHSAWLDLLMVEIIEPALSGAGLAVICHYPAEQAALARLDPDDPRQAERFEVFLDGTELANGYRELTDAAEQRRRFGTDRETRRARGLPDVTIDPALLAALDTGLPDCCGVALGFDRLVMACLGAAQITEVVSFPVPDPP
jgi:lysyl-tRNA synthetase class 2